MRERSIIMRAWEVRAILEGRKTQTRRIVKTKGIDSLGPCGNSVTGYERLAGRDWPGNSVLLKCPYGETGDRLWVKETWGPCAGGVVYRSTCDVASCPDGGKWKPSILMPRWASRITLEIVSVRVKRLHDISGEDAVCEGIERIEVGTRFECWKNYLFKTAHPKHGTAITDKEHRFCGYSSACASYASLWDSIKGPGSWDTNPWVWVVEFKEVKP